MVPVAFDRCTKSVGLVGPDARNVGAWVLKMAQRGHVDAGHYHSVRLYERGDIVGRDPRAENDRFVVSSGQEVGNDRRGPKEVAIAGEVPLE